MAIDGPDVLADLVGHLPWGVPYWAASDGEVTHVTASERSTAPLERRREESARTTEPIAECTGSPGCPGPSLTGRGRATRGRPSWLGVTPATPSRAGWRASTAPAWPRWCRATAVATRSTMVRLSSGASWPKWPGRQRGGGTAQRPGL